LLKFLAFKNRSTKLSN